MKKEIWKDVLGYEGFYQASNLGRIRSVDREIDITRKLKSGKILSYKMKRKGQLISIHEHWKGYLVANIYKAGEFFRIKVHQLVAMAFLDHQPCGMELVVDHINDIKTDNRACNLQLLTNRENLEKNKPGGFQSKYNGVSRYNDGRKKPWFGTVWIEGKQVHVGSFKTEKEAHNAVQTKLKELKNRCT